MAEIMNEIRLPTYFHSFQKKFKFLISETKPNLSAYKNYAICEHNTNFTTTSFCSVKVPHFHILFETTNLNSTIKSRKLFQVPCLYSTFLHLFACFESLETSGDIIQKLILAVEFNKNSKNADGGDSVQFSTPLEKRLPSLKKFTPNEMVSTSNSGSSSSSSSEFIKKPARPTGAGQKTIHNAICNRNQSSNLNCSTQTDSLPKETLDRFEKIINGPHSGVFCKFMDIVLSGYGKVDIDSELLFVKLTYEEKIKV